MARDRMQEEEGVAQIYFTGCAGDIGAGKYNDGSREARGELADRLFAAFQASIAATEYEPIGSFQWRTVQLLLPSKGDSEGEPIGPMDLSSMQLGRVTILHLPGEPMVHFQHFAQGLLPERMVAAAGYGDGSPGYICTAAAFDEGGYEPRASRVAPASQQRLEAAIRQLLGIEPDPQIDAGDGTNLQDRPAAPLP